MSPAYRQAGVRPVVALYVTAGCHLCEEAGRLLRRLARQMRFRLEVVDIASDAALYERYCLAVPVLAVDGEAALSAPLDERRVREALARR